MSGCVASWGTGVKYSEVAVYGVKDCSEASCGISGVLWYAYYECVF